MWKKIKIFFMSILIFSLYRLWFSTWRFELHEPESLKKDLREKTPVLFAFWHGEMLGILPYCKHYPVVSMASVSTDGEIITHIIEWLGIRAARGSSSKKAVQGLKQIIRIAKEGLIPVLPVDGPRGPLHEPKPGVFELSKILNAKIYPGRIISKKNWVSHRSWDKTFLPLPFSRVLLYWGEPMDAISRDKNPRDEIYKLSLKEALNASGQLALKEFDKQ